MGALVQCTIYGNTAPNGSGIAMCGGNLTATTTIVAFNLIGSAFGGSAWQLAFSCCDLYGNQGGDWVGPIANQNGVNGNISLDPLFCNATGGDFHLQDESPCRGHSPQNPDCDTMGAWTVGCEASDVADLAASAGSGITIAPNPSAGLVKLAFRVPSEGPVGVTVVDVSGRVVRSLLAGWHPAGDASVLWDGRDDMGREAPGGVYLAMVTRSRGTSMGRIVLAK